jgi:sugar fermentation stimulation protein A
MRELLTPGAEVRLLPAATPGRVTPYDLTLVRIPTGWVSIDARLPPRLVGEWLAKCGGGFLAGWLVEKAEVRHGASRLDLLLRRGDEHCWVETKSVTLVRDGTALFPDAPTARGRRHLLELQRLAQDGACAAVVFVVQREDAVRFRPNDETDPEFGVALREAADAGVRVLCLRCRVDEEGVEVGTNW